MSKKIIAVANQKGGTSKTTTAASLAVALANLGYAVVLSDMDPQASLSYCFGFENPEKNIEQVLSGKLFVNEALLKIENLSLLASNISLADFELELVSTKDREFVFKNKVCGLLDADFIIIDCPPSFSLLTINALCAATHILVPMQLEVLSTHGLGLVLNSIKRIQDSLNPSLQILGVLPTSYDTRKKVTHEIKDFIKTQHDMYVFENAIRPDVRLIEAPSFGKSIFAFAPNSKAAADYSAFTNELVDKII